MAQKLLLADDSVTIQRVIELTFADENIDVVTVGDGDQAIARLETDPPDIVLADIGMPGRTGYEVSAYVKGSPRLSHIPVVLLTGAFEPVDQTRAAEVRSDGVLAKPFEPQLVIARVKELLAHAGSAAPAAAAVPPAAAAPPVQAPVEAAPEPAAVPPANEARLDDYFDQLDRAFETLTPGQSVAPPAAAVPSPSVSDLSVADIDWFNEVPAAVQAPDVPMSYGSPQPAPASPAAMPATYAAPAAPIAQVPQAAVPTLGDAFAAILAAEEADPASASVVWPAAPRASEEFVEEVTRRVLERLSDRAIRETVTSIVNATADRLIREEIDRLKAAIK